MHLWQTGVMNKVEELRYLVLAAQREGSRALADALRPLGVTPAQAEVLSVVRMATEPLSVRQIGQLLVCETGSPSRLVTNLITAGLLHGTRDAADGRITRLGLTTAGRRIAEQVLATEQEFERHLASDIPDDQTLDVVVDFLRHFVADTPAGHAMVRRRAHEGDTRGR
jgi:MarR family transcriptional regulator, organic hydroperoxide resistance regulator